MQLALYPFFVLIINHFLHLKADLDIVLFNIHIFTCLMPENTCFTCCSLRLIFLIIVHESYQFDKIISFEYFVTFNIKNQIFHKTKNGTTPT